MPSQKRTFAVAILILAVLASSFGYDPPKGGLLLRSIYSPWGLASTPTTTGGSNPWAALLNPSAPGAEQLIRASAAYTGITDFGATSQGWGSAASLGLLLPTPYGVWEGSALFFSAPAAMASMDLGTFGSLRGGFSKELRSDILVGAALGLTMGGNGGFGWGLDLDVGATYLAGDLGFFKDTRFGLSLLGIGKGYTTSPLTGMFGGSASSYPSAFTLGLGARGFLYSSYNWKIDASVDLWSPSFQDIGLDLSLGLAFRDYASLRLGWSAGLRDIFSSPYTGRSFLPSLGLSGTIPLSKGIKLGKTSQRQDADLSVGLAAAPLYDSLYALGAGFS
ncbi:MAG TPA: hypothetical protein VIO60_09760, partial [Rectinemataceae bacterium]